MDSDEHEIFDFLQTWGVEFVSYKEIARRAGGKKRFNNNADWARSVLSRMEERGILEADQMGRYRIKPARSKDKPARWVSPEIAKLLEEKGLKIDGAAETPPEGYYDGL